MSEAGFWSDPTSAQALIKELKNLKSVTDPYFSLKRDLSDAIELTNLAEEADVSILGEIEGNVGPYTERLRSLETFAFFSGENDTRDALLSIHAGTGGVDAMDWAAQLERMYQRWLTKAGFKWEIIEHFEGEAGIKRSVIEVKGQYVYGHLKSEIGVHRICHISEFDANHKKQTSFASVDVIPLYDDVKIDIKESDLEVETMRSGCKAGGQGMQTCNSAVRLTHKPTGLSVRCESQRSQMQNKKKALQLLSSKLQQMNDNQLQQAVSIGYANKTDAAFGYQTRTYAYTTVTDHRTELQVGNVQKVLDGDLMPFIEAYLKFNARSKMQ